jgi:hypothetical protein
MKEEAHDGEEWKRRRRSRSTGGGGGGGTHDFSNTPASAQPWTLE